MTIPGSANPLLMRSAAPTEYQISRSVRFNSSDSAYLSKNFASAGNRKTWTWAGWVKRCKPGQYDGILEGGTSNPTFVLAFRSSDDLVVSQNAGTSAGWVTSAVFRDPSAWYHIVVVVDTTSATGTITNSSTDRIRLYVNGVQQTLSGGSVPTQNSDLQVNNTVAHSLGRNSITPAYSNCYLADIHFIDGQALTPSSFTEVSATTGQLIPIAYTGTYGTNGFHLPFSDNSTAAALGTDTSGNSNTWTVNNISVAAGAGNDSLVDTPTSYGTDTGAGGEVRGNYCTWNPLSFEGSPTLSNGNLDVKASSAAYASTYSTISLPASKTYWEISVVTPQSSFSGQTLSVGTCATPTTTGAPTSAVSILGYSTSDLTSYSYVVPGGGQTNAGTAPTAGDILQFAYDGATGKLWVGLNNTWFASGNPAAGTNPLYTYSTTTSVSAFARLYSTTPAVAANFGQRPFAYTAPSGFKALCDTNLPAPVVAQPSTVMDVKLYTGNGSTQTISGLGFSPDLVWIKGRSGARNHGLFNTVAGVNRGLHSNLTDAEFNDPSTLTAFNSDGFALSTNVTFNANTETFVAWTWDAGTTTASNPDGSITSQVRANASAGFSIVTYTGNGSSGATIGHGLGVEPHFIVCKSRSGSTGWLVYHKSLGNTNYLILNATDASAAAAGAWNNTTPSSTVFTIGNGTFVNTNGATQVSYCFAPVAGYSSFGSYTGNGSADGPFVYTGFRPRWVLIKRTDSNADGYWTLIDTARDTYNVAFAQLYPDLSIAEGGSTTLVSLDFLSNGFKIRNSSLGRLNANGGTYVWAAFAESPFQYARAR